MRINDVANLPLPTVNKSLFRDIIIAHEDEMISLLYRDSGISSPVIESCEPLGITDISDILSDAATIATISPLFINAARVTGKILESLLEKLKKRNVRDVWPKTLAKVKKDKGYTGYLWREPLDPRSAKGIRQYNRIIITPQEEFHAVRVAFTEDLERIPKILSPLGNCSVNFYFANIKMLKEVTLKELQELEEEKELWS
ncbi:MAG: hypothetical protein JW878_05800 [Methanomicrobia archaeon]|nr:hypothetical protein [Methanomicrobia archaeon]